jgi:hypothetical protein
MHGGFRHIHPPVQPYAVLQGATVLLTVFKKAGNENRISPVQKEDRASSRKECRY